MVKQRSLESQKILNTETSEQFLEGMQDRMLMSYHKYGAVKENYKTNPPLIQALPTMHKCVKKYEDTGNTEYLIDAANYLMIEFMYPQIPNAYFKSTKSEESAGQVGISIKELNNEY